MFSLRKATVLQVKSLSKTCEELEVLIAEEKARALNFPILTGPAYPGDNVVLNTTAVELGLGSGGNHFVYLNLAHTEQTLKGRGHIVKLRYTPAQIRVLAVEEELSPHHEQLREAETLSGMPVIIAELHSMLAPVVLTLKKESPTIRIVYVMTDGGSLPAYYSQTVQALRQKGFLDSVISCGHAFGGDLEAVNIYSGLLAAKYVAKADLAVVCMGPGVVGTGTRFGFSGVEMGENINRVHTLQGHAIVLPRISFSDRRLRHNGLSHHTITALSRVALVSADLPLPVLNGKQDSLLREQLELAKITDKHKIYWIGGSSLDHLRNQEIACSTMGRGLDQDPAYFLSAVTAAGYAAGLLGKFSAGAV